MSEIKTAVITGQHAFDVPGFHALFRSIPEIDFYLQDLENSNLRTVIARGVQWLAGRI